MTKKNIEELTDLELIELAKALENFIKYLDNELGDKSWKKNILKT